jgi:hypothetical protein
MPTGAIIRGSGPRDGFPDYIVRSLKRANSGKLTGLCERQFKVGVFGMRISPAWVDQRFAPEPGWGIPCVDCDATTGDGIVVVRYAYEGIESDYTFGEDAITYELDDSMEDEPIETHPAIKLLIDRYGYDVQTRQFPEFDDPSSEGTSGTSGGSKAKRHPLFGVETWRSVGTIFRVTYCVRTVPSRAYRGWGTLITRPEGINKINMPNQPKRPWLRLASQIVRKGNACTITEEAMLGKPGGIPAAKIIYNAAQLEGVSGQ